MFEKDQSKISKCTFPIKPGKIMFFPTYPIISFWKYLDQQLSKYNMEPMQLQYVRLLFKFY